MAAHILHRETDVTVGSFVFRSDVSFAQTDHVRSGLN